MSDQIVVEVEEIGETVEITVVETNPEEVLVEVSNLRGPAGVDGTDGDDCIVLADSVESDGMNGVDVDVSAFNFADNDDYVALVSYRGNPHLNGIVYALQYADHFTIKHSGTAKVLVGYIVSRKV